MPFLRVTEMAAMEPSFWSWEKPFHDSVAEEQQPCRNGAQLLELGKASMRLARTARRLGAAMEPSFWSWEKWQRFGPCGDEFSAAMEPSFWSWEKGRPTQGLSPELAAAMEPSFWSWEKSYRRN